MDLNYKVVNLFPSSIHSLGIDNFDNYKDQLIQETYIERDEDPIGREVSNCGGWQSNEININNEIYTSVSLNNSYPSHNIGNPNLPMLNKIIEIPREAEIAGLDYEIMEAAKDDEKSVASATR